LTPTESAISSRHSTIGNWRLAISYSSSSSYSSLLFSFISLFLFFIISLFFLYISLFLFSSLLFLLISLFLFLFLFLSNSPNQNLSQNPIILPIQTTLTRATELNIHVAIHGNETTRVFLAPLDAHDHVLVDEALEHGAGVERDELERERERRWG
jgi:hypothetical protein